jgi:hypothetical protein
VIQRRVQFGCDLETLPAEPPLQRTRAASWLRNSGFSSERWFEGFDPEALRAQIEDTLARDFGAGAVPELQPAVLRLGGGLPLRSVDDNASPSGVLNLPDPIDPPRFYNFWWTCGEVMGWLADGGDRAKFGRIATAANLSPPIFEDDSEVRERRPEILLLRALQQGLIAHDPRTGPIAPEIWLPSMNEGDIRELFRRGAAFKRDEVLARYPEATAPSLAQAEDEEIVEPSIEVPADLAKPGSTIALFVAWMNAEKKKHATWPPTERNKDGRCGVKEWAMTNGVSRAVADRWAEDIMGKRKRGRPSSSD